MRVSFKNKKVNTNKVLRIISQIRFNLQNIFLLSDWQTGKHYFHV